MSLVAAATLSEVGAFGAIVSNAWLCAALIAEIDVALPIIVEASEIALCTAAFACTATGNMELIVLASAKTTGVTPALVTTVAKFDNTVVPEPATALSAIAAIVATCAAACCAPTLPDDIGS